MRIGEVAQQTGLTISNIRFYEKKGLISPEREEQSKYRDYTDADVRQLKLILLYRKMSLSIETIGELAAGRLPLAAALENQILELQEEQRKLQGSIDLCVKLAGDFKAKEAVSPAGSAKPAVRQEDIDVDRYLNYVKTEEKTGHPFAEAEELLEEFAEFAQYDRVLLSSGLYAWLAGHPWIRRGLAVVWCLFWLLFPLAAIVDACVNGRVQSGGAVIFWGMWLLFNGVSFVQFWTGRNRNRSL